MPDLSDSDFNLWGGVAAVISFFLGDVVDRKIPKAGPFAVSAAIHIALLSAIEFKIKRNEHVSSKTIQLNCNWQTMVTDFNLGYVPTTRIVVADVTVDGQRACEIHRVIEEL